MLHVHNPDVRVCISAVCGQRVCAHAAAAAAAAAAAVAVVVAVVVVVGVVGVVVVVVVVAVVVQRLQTPAATKSSVRKISRSSSDIFFHQLSFAYNSGHASRSKCSRANLYTSCSGSDFKSAQTEPNLKSPEAAADEQVCLTPPVWTLSSTGRLLSSALWKSLKMGTNSSFTLRRPVHTPRIRNARTAGARAC